MTTRTVFYRFPSISEYLDLISAYVDESGNGVEVTLDVIGTLYKATGNLVGVGEDSYPEILPIPGYHVNTTEELAALAAYEVFPVTPYRVFM